MINFLKKLFGMPTPPRVVAIVSGPFGADDVPDSGRFDGFMLALLVENSDGSTTCEECWFDTLDKAYEVVKHFQSSRRPLKIVLDDSVGVSITRSFQG
jgi:hypothetical protein